MQNIPFLHRSHASFTSLENMNFSDEYIFSEGRILINVITLISKLFTSGMMCVI